MPPLPEEVASFVKDSDPHAAGKLVDRLLEDRRYGERWARFWLDLARYADTAGYEGDPDLPHAWRYRDYVIDAFNNDKPYDLFIREQLAGDENPLVLGGFSQGAMLAMDTALRGSIAPPQLLIQFSGTVICRPQWQHTRRSQRRSQTALRCSTTREPPTFNHQYLY